jgi:hypothetical protein
MKLLLVLLILFNCHTCYAVVGGIDVRILVIKQQAFRNRGHHPENNRRVVFRLVNKTSKPVIVYGIKYDDSFDPAGYLVEFSESKNEWVYPNGETSEPSFSGVSSIEKEKYTMKAGRAIEFTAEMSSIQSGKRFRRTAYVVFNDGEPPMEIKSDTFILR